MAAVHPNREQDGAMSDTDVMVHERSLAKGLLAGLIGGLAATAAKTMAEKIYPPRVHGEPEPPDVLVDKLTGHHLEGASKTAATESIHWAFGALAGAAYGAAVEFYPAASSKEGASFGLALATLTHGGALPAMGLAAEPEEQTSRERTSEMSTHVVFGLVTELVRRNVRKFL
jgi:putative membrane protein